MAKNKNSRTEFDGMYQGVEEREPGIGVAYSRKGHYSVFIRMTNPVEQYSADISKYYEATSLFESVIRTLGEGYSVQKQDIFSRQVFDPKPEKGAGYLHRAYMDYFRGREYTEIQTMLIITQEVKQSTFGVYDHKREDEFWNKVQKIQDIFTQKKVEFSFLDTDGIVEYLHRYLGISFRKGAFSYNNFRSMDNYVKTGDRCFRIIDMVDIDEVVMPAKVKPYTYEEGYPVDLFAFLSTVPGADCVIYTQSILIPPQRREMARLQTNYNRKKNVKDPGNQMAAQDIAALMDDIASDGKVLVYSNFSVMIVVKEGTRILDRAFNYVEKKFYDRGIGINQSAYNQLELFISSFPGNQYALKDYERFLCPHDAAACFFYKESTKRDEQTPCKTYYNTRQGVPVVVDFTGKEGAVKYTENSNFFVLGPSGTGKSFHLNSVVRQLHEQDTDIILVDTGNSYEGVCDYCGGTYIAYTSENPITMNPFRISQEENNIEKRNFLKSLILLIWRGPGAVVNNIEDGLINTVINKYYEFYFTPFQGFDDTQKQALRDKFLLSQRSMSEDDKRHIRSLKEKKRKNLELYCKLENMEQGGDGGERENAAILKQETYETLQLLNVTDEQIRQYALARERGTTDEFFDRQARDQAVEDKIVRYEEELRGIRVESLSFNTFYEFCLQYIPIECELYQLNFNIHDFSYTMKSFYKGGEREKTLNDDFNTSLFDQSFIVFEIDSIKEDALLFPIVTLIIMDVFLQKMRLKKNRKALIIEEAWKAIASPVMAGYIQYLYKTVRKFRGMVGVVTQELNDIIGNAIVKDTIVTQSGITVLMDQAKYRDNFGEIKQLLSLTDIECHKIWSINNFDNHEGRAFFKEVYIRRGHWGEVFGCEEPPECYMAYTTERIEKDALKMYIRRYGGHEKGIARFCEDLAQSFPPHTKAEMMAQIVDQAVRIYVKRYTHEKEAERQYIADWKEFDRQNAGALTPQIFAQKIKKQGEVWQSKH